MDSSQLECVLGVIVLSIGVENPPIGLENPPTELDKALIPYRGLDNSLFARANVLHRDLSKD